MLTFHSESQGLPPAAQWVRLPTQIRIREVEGYIYMHQECQDHRSKRRVMEHLLGFNICCGSQETGMILRAWEKWAQTLMLHTIKVCSLNLTYFSRYWKKAYYIHSCALLVLSNPLARLDICTHLDINISPSPFFNSWVVQ